MMAHVQGRRVTGLSVVWEAGQVRVDADDRPVIALDVDEATDLAADLISAVVDAETES